MQYCTSKRAHTSWHEVIGWIRFSNFLWKYSSCIFFFFSDKLQEDFKEKSVLEENVQKNIENGAKNSKSLKSLKVGCQGETLSSN